MPTYKTPDVYVEEISIFPPSVAEVETAIPCFIGYTKKAQKVTADDLHMVPHKVTSMVDYEQYFGGAPDLVSDYSNPLDRVKVVLNESNEPSEAVLDNKYYMYDSMKLFYDNGGGKCYVISVGKFPSTIIYGTTTTGLRGGLEALKKKDEPTMIVFPDAVLLSGADELYQLQQQALAQSGKLMDRVTICDLKNSGDHDADVEEFRSKIGIKDLKYGAAYSPWLKTRLPKNIKFRDLLITRSSGSTVSLENLTKDTDTKGLIKLIHNAIAATDDINADVIDANRGAEATLLDHFQAEVDDYDANASGFVNIGDFRNALRDLYTIIIEVSKTFHVFGAGIADSGEWKLKTDFDTIVSNNDLTAEMQKLLYNSKGFDGTAIITNATFAADINPHYAGLTNAGDGGTIDAAYVAAADDPAKGELAKVAAQEVFSAFNSAVNDLLDTSKNYEIALEDGLKESFALYKSILQKISDTLTEIPPSGAIAGAYAYVDGSRGVHKAPANISLSGVTGLTYDIDFEEQKDLNVDVNAGKSVNAIRTFAGKGILIWGARTLAGNDNEWRYVPVRRFFNMVEESVKKSTSWAVFEPNDANLWVRIKAMIENYLFQKWRDGALAGATPDDAYFVKVGLGLTMTSQDILEGRLNVEIGMAVVRPAEFIVLKFSHKMQES